MEVSTIERNLATHKRQFLQSDEMIQEEPKEFREVPAGYFDIKDEKQIEELCNILKQNNKNKKQSFQLNGLQSKSETKDNIPESDSVEKNFQDKTKNLFSALDNCKKQIEIEKSEQFQENKFLYYNLEDVEYRDKEALSEAFSFLRNLEKQEKEKKKQEMQSDEQMIEEEFDILTFKPSYQQSLKKQTQQATIIKTEEQKLKKRIQNLTIEDEEEEEQKE